MSIEFVKNSCPVVTQEMYDFFEKHKECYGIDLSGLTVNDRLGFENFFDIKIGERTVGFVFFNFLDFYNNDVTEEDKEFDVEIAVGNLSVMSGERVGGLLELTLSNLEQLKNQLPKEWFDGNRSNCAKYWGAIVYHSNPAYKSMKKINEQFGFQDASDELGKSHFKKSIAL